MWTGLDRKSWELSGVGGGEVRLGKGEVVGSVVQLGLDCPSFPEHPHPAPSHNAIWNAGSRLPRAGEQRRDGVGAGAPLGSGGLKSRPAPQLPQASLLLSQGLRRAQPPPQESSEWLPEPGAPL